MVVHTDTYLAVRFPGMSDWVVEEIRSDRGELRGYSVTRRQTAALRMPGCGNEHLLDDMRALMQRHANELNRDAEFWIMPNHRDHAETKSLQEQRRRHVSNAQF